MFVRMVLGLIIVIGFIIQIDTVLSDSPGFGLLHRSYADDHRLIQDRQNLSSIPERYTGEDHTMQYNYATSLAMYGEQVGLPDAIPYREQAVDKYQTLLQQDIDSSLHQYTSHNLKILQDLLEQNQGSQESSGDTQQESQESQSGDESNEDQSQGSQSGENQDGSGQTQQPQPPTGEGSSGLTPDQLQQLQNYQDQLQRQQFQNQQYFGKQSNDQPQSIFEQFFGKSQFDQGGDSTTRDW